MDFYLLSPDNRDLHFPVNPSELTVHGEKQIETVNIINIGEIDFPTGDKRAEIRFSSFFPQDYDSGYCRYPDIPDPREAIEQLITWRNAGKPVRLIITDSPVNTLVLIKSVPYMVVGGQPGDIYFDIEMRTWREVKVRTAAEVGAVAAVAGTNSQRPRPDTKPVPKVYVVKPGDNLFKIAKLQLGAGSKWQDIYNNNKSVVGPDPGLIKPGMKLVMPA